MSTATMMDYNFLAHWHSAALTSVGLFWTAWWAFCLGYLISSMIQVFVTRTRMQQLMGKTGFRSVLLGTLFGFISSSCSFAALSGTRALFTKGAGLVPSLAYLLSSTNLVIELGIIIAIFLSWQFVVGEYVGGILLILFMWLIVDVTQHYVNVEGARQHAREQEVQGNGGGCDMHNHHHGDEGSHDKPHKDKEHDIEDQDGTHESNEDVEHGTNNENTAGDDEEKHDDQFESTITNNWKRSLLSRSKWQQVAMHYFMEWSMVWKDVTVGFTVAGIIAAFVPNIFFQWLFIGGANPNFWQVLEQTLIGPVAAFFTFIGSMGNIPLAAVLYINGVSFAGIMAFIFSDLIVLPILRINARYYGWAMALYIMAVMFASLVATALVLYYVFGAIGILPSGDNVSAITEQQFFALDYTFGLNIAFGVLTMLFFGMYFSNHGFPKCNSGGGSATENVLFWLAVLSYAWLLGGLFAGLANS
mmetsp:Transcript_24930/g.45064  ORF Transcript_24930/g.45064 Transcript_24930/m.45064 type:complete len:473 (+) Transcript_24930:474-1892(+)